MRNSSVELYRIIATLLVVITHFNGWFVSDIVDKLPVFSIQGISQRIIEAASCVCVNCFLVITGWYGMSFKWKHVFNIWSVIAWIYVGFYIFSCCLGEPFSILKLLARFVALEYESYYITCYLMLLILSPILNSFIQKYRRKILPYVIALWAIEIVFDWILKMNCLGFGRGYMLTHFMLMYLLGQTAYLYKNDIYKVLNSYKCMATYLSGILMLTSLSFVLPSEMCYAYSNPFNIIMAFSLFFIFEGKTFYSKTINWIAKGTLAVYVVHITPPVLDILREWDAYALTSYSYGVYLCVMVITVLTVFCGGVLYDKIKSLFMPPLGKLVCGWLSSKTDKFSLPDE